MKLRISLPKSIKLIIITNLLLIFIFMPAYAALWGNKVDTQDLQRIITELRIYDDPNFPYYNEIFRICYTGYSGSEELLDALNKKIEITQQVIKILDADAKKEELGNLTYGRYILNAINEKELVEMGLKTGSPGQANGEYFSKLSGNLADWKSQLNKFLLTKIIVATCTAMGAPGLSIGISTLGLFCDLSIIGISLNKLNEVWYEKAFWSYMQFRNDHNWDHYDAWKGYAEPFINHIFILSPEKQEKAREAIEENFESLWDKYGDHIVNNKLDEDFKSQQRESLKILLLYALGSKPHPIITSPLNITPPSPYQVGDIINAEFTIANQGTLPIKFSVLTVGGRDSDNQVADFSHRQNIILKPLESYDYKGTFALNKTGDYHFFCTYQTPDDEWNTNVDLGSGLTDENRTEDISVEEKEKPSIVTEISDKINIEWDKTFGGSDNDRPYSIVQTNDGGYAVAGSTKSKGAGKLDAWIIKLDNKGNLEWDKTFGRSDDDEAYSMTQTTDGGYVMAGYTYKSGYFFWIIKLDNKGNLEWDKTFGRSNNECGYSIIQTIDGGYAVVGSTMSSKKPGVTQKCIAWLIKLDDKGNKMWDKIFGRSDNDGVYYSIVQGGIQGGKAYSLIQTNDGGYVVTALTSETLEKDNDLWIIKLDDKGNKMWDKIFKKSGTDYGLGWSFIQTNDGGYATAGHISLKGEGGINALLIKLDNKGNLEWDKTFGGSNRAVYSIIQTKDSGYALAGTKFEVPGVWDTWLIKLDNKGNLEWDKTFGGSERDLVESLIQTNDVGYALVGLTESKGAGKRDVWVIKLSSKSIEALEEEVAALETLEDKIEKEKILIDSSLYHFEYSVPRPWFKSARLPIRVSGPADELALILTNPKGETDIKFISKRALIDNFETIYLVMGRESLSEGYYTLTVKTVTPEKVIYKKETLFTSPKNVQITGGEITIKRGSSDSYTIPKKFSIYFKSDGDLPFIFDEIEIIFTLPGRQIFGKLEEEYKIFSSLKSVPSGEIKYIESSSQWFYYHGSSDKIKATVRVYKKGKVFLTFPMKLTIEK